MWTRFFAATAIALGTAAVMPTAAHAATVDDCQGLITLLDRDTAGAQSLTARARAGLLDKAEAASTKLDAGKVSDASAKLTDFDSTLDALHGAAKPKVSEEDFVLLSGDVDAALACVATIGP